MFNSTLTEDEALFCPADGSIMITGKLHIKNLWFLGLFREWIESIFMKDFSKAECL